MGHKSHHRRQQVEPRFVLKNQHPALAASPPTQLRPGSSRQRSMASRSAGWPAGSASGRPAQFLEQAADVDLVVADAEFLLDDAGDAGAGPDPAAEAVGLRPVPEELRDQALLGIGELRRAPRSGAGEQARAAAAGAREPAADRLLETPKASAMSRWYQPCCFKCNAR